MPNNHTREMESAPEDSFSVGDAVLVNVPRWIPDDDFSDFPSGYDMIVPAGTRGTITAVFSRDMTAMVAIEEDNWEMLYRFSELERI